MLIEDSPYPVSSPAWGPDGHALVYSRFVPEQGLLSGEVLRGRYELVLQEALDRKRVIPLLPELEATAEQIASLAELRGSWSPDGRFVVIGRPATLPGLLVVSLEQGRVLKTIERAIQPVWSPDGARLAMLRLGRDPSSGWSLQLMARDFGGGRSLVERAEPSVPPTWNPDGQSILIVAAKSRLQPHDLELMRVFLDSGMSTRAFHLGSKKPDESERFFSISLDRELEQCVFSADDNDEVSALAFASVPRQQRFKRFHPLDFSMRLGSLALDPEGQFAAVRIETSRSMAPVLLCNLATEAVTLLAPDANVRREWPSSLVATARDLIATALPPPVLNGRPIPRQGILPLPGEIPDQNPILSRLRHLGKIGRGFLDQPPGVAGTSVGDEPGLESLDEFRLFFDYLQGDYAAALVDLDLLESRSESRDGRLLSLRAQILQAQGESRRAQATSRITSSSPVAMSQRIEDTPAGPVLSPVEDPITLWYRYMAQQLAAVSVSKPTPTDDESGTEDDAARLIVPHLLEGLNRGRAGGRVRFPFPNRLPGPGGPGVGRFGGPPARSLDASSRGFFPPPPSSRAAGRTVSDPPPAERTAGLAGGLAAGSLNHEEHQPSRLDHTGPLAGRHRSARNDLLERSQRALHEVCRRTAQFQGFLVLEQLGDDIAEGDGLGQRMIEVHRTSGEPRAHRRRSR